MNSTFVEEINYAVKNWWMSLILGILFIAVAIFLLFTPGESYLAISMVFSICMFASGIFEIAFSISNKNILSGWGWYLFAGIIDLIMGLILVFIPELSMALIPFLVAFWLMFRGFSAIGFGFDLQRYGSHNWGWYLIFGILAVLCSIGVIWQPAAGALTVVYVTAFAFMFIGVFRVMLSFELKGLHNNVQELKKRIQAFQEKMNKPS